MVDDLQINEEYKRIPQDIAYWNIKLSKALRAKLHADFEKDQMESKLRIQHRARLEIDNAKVTIDMVTSAIDQDDEMKEAKLNGIDAEAEYQKIRGIAAAVSAKKDVLQSLGANIRAELEGSPTLREQALYRRRAVED